MTVDRISTELNFSSLNCIIDCGAYDADILSEVTERFITESHMRDYLAAYLISNGFILAQIVNNLQLVDSSQFINI